MSEDPKSDAEWQEAVDAAHALLVLDSARLYGLITGGPEIDVGRCLDILKRGSERGLVPAPDAVEGLASEMAAERTKGRP